MIMIIIFKNKSIYKITSNKSKKTYRILQEISEGAFGTVYKVAENNEM